MVTTLIIDLEENYILQNIRTIKEYSGKYKIKMANAGYDSDFLKKVPDEPVNPWNVLVLSDAPDAAIKWKGYAVLAVEHGKRISGIEYVAEGLKQVEDGYMNYVYSRKFHLPVIIKETSRLILREITPGDAEAVLRLYEDRESTQYIPGLSGQEMERETVAAYIKNMYGFYGYGMWVVVRKRDNCLIGRAGIENRMISGTMYHEIGYFIGKGYRKRGYGKEAAQAVVKAAEELGIRELIAYINKKNTPSIKLSQNLGFHYWRKLYDGEKYVIYRKRLALS